MKNPGRNETRCDHMGSIPATHINETGGDTGPSHLKIRVLVHEGSYDPKEQSKGDPRALKIEEARMREAIMVE